MKEDEKTTIENEDKNADLVSELAGEKPAITTQEKSKPSRKLKSVTDVFGDGEFYPDDNRADFKDILGMQLVLEDAKILKDFNSEYGKHDAGLMLFSNPDNETERFTTICSGEVVVERLQRIIKQRLMPILATPIEVTTGRNRYYNIT